LDRRAGRRAQPKGRERGWGLAGSYDEILLKEWRKKPEIWGEKGNGKEEEEEVSGGAELEIWVTW
jgi:hypothetical protein